MYENINVFVFSFPIIHLVEGVGATRRNLWIIYRVFSDLFNYISALNFTL